MITAEAVILAGGFGSRLQSVVSDRPKPMAGINGRPFLEYLLDYLGGQGIGKVILSVGFRYEIIRDHFQYRYRNMDLCYAIEEEPLGTGGGLRNSLRMASSETVFVVNGDTFFDIPLAELEKLLIRHNADMTMALRSVNLSGRYGTVRIERNGRITGFSEKQNITGTAFINGGIYLIKRNLLDSLELPGKFSLEKDFLENGCRNFIFFGKPFRKRFIDIGIPESYRRAQSFFRHKTV